MILIQILLLPTILLNNLLKNRLMRNLIAAIFPIAGLGLMGFTLWMHDFLDYDFSDLKIQGMLFLIMVLIWMAFWLGVFLFNKLIDLSRFILSFPVAWTRMCVQKSGFDLAKWIASAYAFTTVRRSILVAGTIWYAILVVIKHITYPFTITYKITAYLIRGMEAISILLSIFCGVIMLLPGSKMTEGEPLIIVIIVFIASTLMAHFFFTLLRFVFSVIAKVLMDASGIIYDLHISAKKALETYAFRFGSPYEYQKYECAKAYRVKAQ